MQIAERFNGEIVNCDSLQLYRGLNIGTAKPSVEERAMVPHHLFDILEPHELFTAGDYMRIARPLLRTISERGHLPVVVGGTGFYIRALLLGLFSGPSRDDELRNRLTEKEQRRPGFLHRLLARLDPNAARRIHANDKNKLIRAVEVCIGSRRPMTELFKEGRDALTGFEPLKIVLEPPRKELHHKLDRRCEQMLEVGLIHEVALLLLSGIPPKSKAFESIGYKETIGYLLGQLELTQALGLMQRDTRRYAKRQQTWFRREPDAVWVRGFGTDPAVSGSVINMLANYMQGQANY